MTTCQDEIAQSFKAQLKNQVATWTAVLCDGWVGFGLILTRNLFIEGLLVGFSQVKWLFHGRKRFLLTRCVLRLWCRRRRRRGSRRAEASRQETAVMKRGWGCNSGRFCRNLRSGPRFIGILWGAFLLACSVASLPPQAPAYPAVLGTRL